LSLAVVLLRAAVTCVLAVGAATLRADEAGQASLKLLNEPGHFLIMRHALAPGIGDPENFKLDDCETQRNLSDDGRAQARRLGEALRAAGIKVAQVYSSRWCRCLETARLLDVGPVTPLETLNSLRGRPGESPAQMEQLRADIDAMDLAKPTVLVTHQVVISALTGKPTGSGDGLVVKRLPDGRLEIAGAVAGQASQ